MPDATLAASYQAYNDANRRSDKAFTPHPTFYFSTRSKTFNAGDYNYRPVRYKRVMIAGKSP